MMVKKVQYKHYIIFLREEKEGKWKREEKEKHENLLRILL